MTEVPPPLTAREATEALQLARRSLESFVRDGVRLRPSTALSGGLAAHSGAFVTLHTRDGRLRGCIGHMISDEPLGELLIELGIAAGTQDHRFPPVSKAELAELTFDISVLSPMFPIAAADVTPGVHGLLIRRGRRQGVLLPQVASEWGWGRETFLAETCEKAGLSPDAWQQSGTEILAFTAQVCHE